jgi:hypothetical protein
MPTLDRAQAWHWGPLIGLIAGTAQGGAGASGPITTSYLLSMEMPRGTFLFAINMLFVVLDTTQALALTHLGVIRARDLGGAALVSAFLGVGMCVRKDREGLSPSVLRMMVSRVRGVVRCRRR